MAEVADFVGTLPLVAHHARFDSGFWDAELSRIGRQRRQSFVCLMLVAKRVMPQAASYKLGSLLGHNHTGRDIHGRLKTQQPFPL